MGCLFGSLSSKGPAGSGRDSMPCLVVLALGSMHSMYAVSEGRAVAGQYTVDSFLGWAVSTPDQSELRAHQARFVALVRV